MPGSGRRSDGPCRGRLVTTSNAVVVLPDHRLSVEAPYPAALDDCYDAVLWLRDHAGDLGVAEDQLVVGGESAGGRLTTAVTLVASPRPRRGRRRLPAAAVPDDRRPSHRLLARQRHAGVEHHQHRRVVDWCERLRAAGVPVTLEVYRGAFHGFDLVAAFAPVSRQARAFLVDGFRDHLARYRAPQPAHR